MKSVLTLIFALSAFSTAAFGYDLQTVERALDIRTSLMDVAQSLENPAFRAGRDGRLMLLDGTVASISIQNQDADSFEAVVELAVGTWQESEQIRLYNAFFLFSGSQMAAHFSRDASPDVAIQTGDQLLVIARPLGTTSDPIDGSETLLFSAEYARFFR